MSTSDKFCDDGASKSNDDDVSKMNDMLHNMSTFDNEGSISICANCGKEGNSDNMNTCNKCKMVKYCNAACKKKHRSKHKKHCERRVAELHDEALFKQPPPEEDCPICFLRLPTLNSGRRYQSCCGKTICSGCCYAPVYDHQGNKVDNKKCPFCRTSKPDKEEMMKRIMKRMEANDAMAIHSLGVFYARGMNGYPADHTKALELWYRASELGSARPFNDIGRAYDVGQGVERDEKKAAHYYELAAMRGDVCARHNIGLNEGRAGNMERALKHYMIAVRDGFNESLEKIRRLYTEGYATKEDYTEALQLYQEYLGEIKSVHRDKAAAYDDLYRYY